MIGFKVGELHSGFNSTKKFLGNLGKATISVQVSVSSSNKGHSPKSRCGADVDMIGSGWLSVGSYPPSAHSLLGESSESPRWGTRLNLFYFPS